MSQPPPNAYLPPQPMRGIAVAQYNGPPAVAVQLSSRMPTASPVVSIPQQYRPATPQMQGTPNAYKRQQPTLTMNALNAGNRSHKKKRNLGDRLIPPQVCDLVPESQAYMDLVSFEQKLDATISRKKLDIQEALKRPMKVKRRLRIYVSHTFYPGKESEKEGEDGAVPTWELRVEGRLLDESTNAPGTATPSTNGATPAAPAPAAAPAKTNVPKKKFSSFFKSLVIELDKDIYGPDNHLVEWHRTPQTNETDGFQVKRPGDRNVKCTILLLLDYQPMKFKVNPALSRILGVHTETRPKIIEALWQYVKTHKLQDSHERDHINCDPYLEQVFKCARMRFMEIPQRLQHLLHQPDPIVIHHTITVEGSDPKKTACYDIDVEIEDPLKIQMQQFAMSQANQADIQALDLKIYDTVDQIQELKIRRDFYLQFTDEPIEFIEKWLASQSRDLQTMMEIQGQPETERKSEYFSQGWVDEGVHRYFFNKVQQRRAELDQTMPVKQ